MDEWKNYRKSGVTEMRPYVAGESMDGITLNGIDAPSPGGMIARNAKDPNDQWYVGAQYFADNYEPA